MPIQRHLHLIAYDVGDPGRLRAALHLARHYATGGQKSVHECWLTAAEKGRLLADLAQLLEENRDRLLSIRLDPRQKTVTLGRGVAPENPDWFYLG